MASFYKQIGCEPKTCPGGRDGNSPCYHPAKERILLRQCFEFCGEAIIALETLTAVPSLVWDRKLMEEGGGVRYLGNGSLRQWRLES